jgi:hypothetical protein
VPNSIKVFNFRNITRRLRFNGHSVSWGDVTELNLQVSLGADRDPVLTALPRCYKCVRDHSADCDRCRELKLLKFDWRTLQS